MYVSKSLSFPFDIMDELLLLNVVVFYHSLISFATVNIGRYSYSLTHICLVDFPILINWASPFTILWVSGVLFNFCSIFNR